MRGARSALEIAAPGLHLEAMENSLPVLHRPASGLVLDVVADFTCPWSFLGTRRIVRALDAVQGLPTPPVLRWHGFRLPRPAAEGSAWQAHLAQRLPPGISVEFAENSLEEAGRVLGIHFDFGRISVVPDTLHAHRLVLAAVHEGLHVPVADAIFSAYFEQGRDIGREDVLVAIARDCGVDEATIASFERGFASTAALGAVPSEDGSAASTSVAVVLAEEQRLRSLGVQNVPNLLLNGHVLVPGPAEESIYVQALDQVLFPQAPDASPPRWLH
jgi:predicted DsbA family dithiol-disulfide isomerase